MKRRVVIASTLLILACAAWRPAQAATEIAFGITSNTALSLAHYVASERKYYEAENLKVDTIVAGAAVGVLQQLAEQLRHPTDAHQVLIDRSDREQEHHRRGEDRAVVGDLAHLAP